jgi:hypothetical protein
MRMVKLQIFTYKHVEPHSIRYRGTEYQIIIGIWEDISLLVTINKTPLELAES